MSLLQRAMTELRANRWRVCWFRPRQREDKGTPLLVGKQVTHRFTNGKYNGKVITVVPGSAIWYNIKYENDKAIYVYNLGEDYKQSDLELLIWCTYIFVRFLSRTNRECTHLYNQWWTQIVDTSSGHKLLYNQRLSIIDAKETETSLLNYRGFQQDNHECLEHSIESWLQQSYNI